MRWQPPAAGPAGRGAAGAGVGGDAGGGEGGCPPRPAAASRNLQEAVGPGERGEGAWRGAEGPGPAGSGGPPGGSAGKEGRGEGRGGRRVPGPCGHAPKVAAGAAACLPVSPDSDLASPGRAGAAARAALMARFRAAERAPSRSLSGLGTCPSASRGLLSMESGASRRPQRAGSGRAQLGDQAQRRSRPRERLPLPPAPCLPAGCAPSPLLLPPPSQGLG